MDDSGASIPGVDLAHVDVEPLGDVLHGFLALGDDADRLGNGLGGDGMVAGDHDNLDTSRTALGDGVGDGSAGRVNHGHEADKAEALNGEVAVIGVEGIAAGIFVQGEDEVAEAQHTLTQPAQLHVGRVEGVLPLLSGFR